LVLVAAVYDQAVAIQLTFDRAIDVAGLVASQIIVDDGEFEGHRYQATGEVDLFNPETAYLYMQSIGPATGDETFLDAGPGTGIVALSNGGAWAGASHLLLPFP